MSSSTVYFYYDTIDFSVRCISARKEKRKRRRGGRSAKQKWNEIAVGDDNVLDRSPTKFSSYSAVLVYDYYTTVL